MANETINILRIDGTQAITTLRDLKAEIEKDKDALVALGLVEDGDADKKAKQAQITEKLSADMKLLNQVTAASKGMTLDNAKAISTSTASYYDLQRALTTLKKAWKDMSAEERATAEGGEILQKIRTLDVELKTLDSNIGQYQRNVGNYGQTFKESLDQAQKGAMGFQQGLQSLAGIMALTGDKSDGLQKAIFAIQSASLLFQSAKGMGGLIDKARKFIQTMTGATAATNAQTAAMTAEATATTTATTATKAFRTALMSTGIGAIVVALGALIANLDKISSLLGLTSKESEAAFKKMKEDLEATNQLWKDKANLMKAAGDVQEAVTNAELEGLRALLDSYRDLEVQAWETYGITSDEVKKAHDQVIEGNKALMEALDNARYSMEGFIKSAETTEAQRGMSDYEKAVDRVNRQVEALRKTNSLLQLEGKITGQEWFDNLSRISNAQQIMLDELAEKERKTAAARYKSEKDAADQIRINAENALKTEEQRLTDKYNADLAKLQKYHLDSTALTEKYQKDLKALQDKADAEEEAKREKRLADRKKELADEVAAEQKANKAKAEARLTELEKAQEYDTRRAEYTITNEEELATRTYEIDIASYQQRIEALQAFAAEAMALNDQETALQYQQEAADLSVEIELRTLQEKERIRKRDADNQKKAAQQTLASVSGIFGALADIYDANGEADAKAQKKAKNLRIASATIDMFQGAVTAYSSAQVLGPIAGPIVGAINAAAVIAAGTANIAKIKAQDVSGSGDSSATPSAAVVEAPTIEPAMQEVRTITGASEEDRLNQMASDQRVYILSSDIEADTNAKRVQVAETTF